MREQLLAYVLKYQGEYAKIKKAIKNNEPWQPCKYEGNYITMLDEAYPRCFFQLDEPPYVLFYKGDLSLLEKPMLCVIGSRNMSKEGGEACDCLIRHCNSEFVILSGLAKGIDACAHAMALKYHRKSVAIIGCGINRIYPIENRMLYEQLSKGHLILSEYPDDAPPLAYHFPWRNRLLAALCSKLVVVEAKERSGTMITVTEALSLNKDIYVFPYRFNDAFGKGCNLLIQQGANLLISDEDIENL